jgi:hypothetical protein
VAHTTSHEQSYTTVTNIPSLAPLSAIHPTFQHIILAAKYPVFFYSASSLNVVSQQPVAVGNFTVLSTVLALSRNM